MIEKIILDALGSGLDAPVFMEVPEDPPEKYIVLERTGSGENGYHRRTATMAVQSYGPTMLDVAELNETVMDVMRDLQYNENTIISCVLSTAYNYTDQEAKRYRYQAVYSLDYFA